MRKLKDPQPKFSIGDSVKALVDSSLPNHPRWIRGKLVRRRRAKPYGWRYGIQLGTAGTDSDEILFFWGHDLRLDEDIVTMIGKLGV